LGTRRLVGDQFQGRLGGKKGGCTAEVLADGPDARDIRVRLGMDDGDVVLSDDGAECVAVVVAPGARDDQTLVSCGEVELDRRDVGADEPVAALREAKRVDDVRAGRTPCARK